MNEARIADDGGSFVVNHPVLDGVKCEVQHPLKTGLSLADGLGLIGFGVVTLPNGQPRVMLQVKHADGTALHGMLKGPAACALLECLAEAIREAQAIADAASRHLPADIPPMQRVQPLDLGGATIGMVERPDGSVGFVP